MFKVHTQTTIAVSQLNPSAYNPRKITPEKFEALKDSIKSEGFVDPIVVQKKGMRIIGGHQRLRAVKEIAVELGESPPDLPCTILDIDDKRAKKLNVKLNNAKGDNDARALGELFVDIYDKPENLTPYEAQSLGFAPEEALEFFHLIEPKEPLPDSGDGGAGSTKPETFGKSLTLTIEFDSIAARDRVKKALLEAAKVEKKKTGDVVGTLLFRKKPSASKPAKKKRAA